ncbi:TMEM175 family protein [Deinococcus sp.]|uniref:TMEM175 family protein n=1 Tax=Deinococcus sp. TaxID=47478 RepID=UPI0025C6D1AF|nr:TMEM175 family protein [Deinococcus sp.]
MNKARMEAFSDGVLAIIITIMVLELPRPEGHDWSTLYRLWPTLLSYALSFIYVGIYWNNHHHLMHTVRRIGGQLLWANLHLLFWLSLFPYVTGWAGESHFAPVPMTCYGIVALMCALSWLLLTRAIIAAGPQNSLLAQAMGRGLKETLSLVGYLVAIVAPFFGHIGVVVAGLALMAVALGWLIPDRRIERVLQATETEE